MPSSGKSEGGGQEPKGCRREDLSDLRYGDDEVVAVLCSDLHLSHTPPRARAESQTEWYGVMARQLAELRDVSDTLYSEIVVAGDVFDSWRPPPELIRFALDNLPPVFAVAGQHDAPYHKVEDLHRSAYGVLTAAHRIRDLKPGEPRLIHRSSVRCEKNVYACGFPWREPLGPPPQDLSSPSLKLAVVHHYVWADSQTKYHGAPEEDQAKLLISALAGFDVVVSGDNHKGFLWGRWFNAGAFFRRHADERDYRPWLGLLHASGAVTPYYLDVSRDRFVDGSVAIEKKGVDAEGFLAELESLGESGVDFAAAVVRYLDRTPVGEGVRRRLLDAIGAGE